MTTQTSGTLKSWNQDKGFGFITPTNGGQDIFVHISNYPRAGGAPTVGESLLFEVTLNKEGKKKAINVSRPGQPASRRPAVGPHRAHKEGPSIIGRLMTGILVVAVLGAGYKYLLPKLSGANAPPAAAIADSGTMASAAPSMSLTSSTSSGSIFQCDGRCYCSQMTSCEEAKYFLRNCPNTEMDGDHDGVPCESQWCTNPFAK